MFRFIGKNSSKYNNPSGLGYLNGIASCSGVKLGYTKDGFGNKYNAIVVKGAKADKYGVYSQKDSLANFRDAQACSSYLNGFYAGVNRNKNKR